MHKIQHKQDPVTHLSWLPSELDVVDRVNRYPFRLYEYLPQLRKPVKKNNVGLADEKDEAIDEDKLLDSQKRLTHLIVWYGNDCITYFAYGYIPVLEIDLNNIG